MNEQQDDKRGGGNVIQDSEPTGTIPSSSIAVLSDDSKYLYKSGQRTRKYKASAYDMYAAVLSGTRQQVNEVVSHCQNNTYEYDQYNPDTYSGRCKAPVEAFFAGAEAVNRPTRPGRPGRPQGEEGGTEEEAPK